MKPIVIVITKQTSYSRYVQNTESTNVFQEIKEMVERGDPAVARWKASHEAHSRTLDIVTNEIAKCAEMLVFDASSFIAEMKDVALVVTVGGDGTLLAASHNVHGQIPVLGVNSDPNTSVGYFCTATAETFPEQLRRALGCTCVGIALTRMKVSKNKRIIDTRVLNDVLFCHTSPATTSNYILTLVQESPTESPFDWGEVFQETQKSSGFWVGPPAGSTAARRSAGFRSFPMHEKDLQLAVRELYYKPGSEPGRREVVAKPGQSIHAISKMDSAAMYIDGDYKVVPVGLGDELVFEVSNDPLWLLGRPDVLCR
jgi:NAD+ kinase